MVAEREEVQAMIEDRLRRFQAELTGIIDSRIAETGMGMEVQERWLQTKLEEALGTGAGARIRGMPDELFNEKRADKFQPPIFQGRSDKQVTFETFADQVRNWAHILHPATVDLLQGMEDMKKSKAECSQVQQQNKQSIAEYRSYGAREVSRSRTN